ncbi:MAG: hypothetical protein UU73_C0001G0174 [Candidatus Daviesbacteria bacterium GW2011_GWA1_41_61]|uniref:Uncharacterized protein n=1 Tax=Candidatus Daviesbacteria bacterium GW2011_GWA2_40_9 TaxID=1618424 RepID=A0A0G0WDK2_9BACT|nr:MAG: hypothetical protein UU26_C0006G0012 [Candidatus Daviesbacteria bacterium GW2011_GWC1_40_9]KKR82340.1 MAG: hypothetical protein UU29_C0015G0006 [Candidatus Daviesbacteria bacterium GW2011_GWA2_40_9]KKR92993.1 MAG: hypothetical protein UU44_C0004G0175 [Candidatus Daviesbacteria bacterium GW2011_GWB1_41_15]KKS15537.1 MAG: hypothetical protein UU73_C0001G0174 [Candidatus Daviesbacteria bacterium GW2011_GWA1_41_61]
MNILFAIKKDVYSAMEPLGILYLSSFLKTSGHQVFLSDSSFEKVSQCIKEKNIGLFAISCMNTDYKYYLNLSQQVKKTFPKILIIWGGPTPTYNPEIINQDGIDIICRGEGEIALLKLVDKLDQKQSINKVPNMWIKNKNSEFTNSVYKNSVGPLVADLDSLPFPDRSLTRSFPQFKYSPIKIVMASRGCPFNCSFCFNHRYHHLYQGKGKIIRTRTVDNVIAELEDLKRNFNAKFFYFLDDVFPFDRQWLTDFTKKYTRKINLPFTIVTSVVFIDERFVKFLKKAGCVSIHLAVECGSERIRKEVLNKNITNFQIIKACNITKKYGLAISAYNMVGIPTSTFADELQTLDLNLKAGVDATYVSFCLPFLDTQLGKVAKKMNLISSETEFLSWFERIPIQVVDREKIEKFASLFTFIVIFPFLRSYLPILLKVPIPKSVLKFLKDVLNGYSLKRKIIPVRVGWKEFLVTSSFFVLKRFTK